MHESMALEIITPSGVVLDRVGVLYLEVKGSEGILGIYPNHSQFLTTLLPSAIYFKTAYHKYDMAMSNGIIYVTFDKVTILADAAFFKNQIDYRATQELLNNARLRLKDTKEKEDQKKLLGEIETEEAKLKLADLPGRARVQD